MRVRKEVYGLSKAEALEVLNNLNYWEWDGKLGREPFFFNELERYKKPDNLRYRLYNLLRVIWPFTKEDYIQPIRNEIFKIYPELKHGGINQFIK